jgi:hypothetical protein
MATTDRTDTGSAPAAGAPGRRQIIARTKAQKRRNRPFIIAGILILLAVLVIPAVAYVREFVLPPRELAVRVNDKVYTRGDVVDFIRFHQRLAEESAAPFNITDNLLGALETISDNEIAFQRAPSMGVTVTTGEIDAVVRDSIGFPRLSAEEANAPLMRSDIKESLRQLLNRIQMSESTYREIVRKQLFRDKVRQVLAADVSRIQPQVHVYSIDLTDADLNVFDRARKRLAAGEPIEEVAVDLSVAPDIARTRGEVGWFPQGVDLDNDRLYFGTTESLLGPEEPRVRVLPLRTLSEPVWDGEASIYHVYYISELAETREVDDAAYDALSERALRIWIADQQPELDEYALILNSEIFGWIGKQVRLSAIRPTPTPEPPPFAGLGFGP